MPTKPDDFDAVRSIVATLSPFDAGEQERILRWSREKLGLAGQATGNAPAPNDPSGIVQPLAPPRAQASATDIKSFVTQKAPTSNNEFAATVAYYHRFEANESARKEVITADDLQEACRVVGRARLRKPAQTLINAHHVGLIDKAGDRGAYGISTVGENLVAMTLPADGRRTPSRSPSRKRATIKKAKKAGRSRKRSLKQSEKV